MMRAAPPKSAVTGAVAKSSSHDRGRRPTSRLGGVDAEQPLDAFTPGSGQDQPGTAAQHHVDISVTGGMELGHAIELDDR
jgi:hypothetical protein